MLRGAVGGLADTGEFVEEFALPSEDLRDPLVDASLGEEPMDLNGLHLSHSGRPRDCLPLGRRLSCGSQITTTDAAWMLRPTPPRMKQALRAYESSLAAWPCPVRRHAVRRSVLVCPPASRVRFTVLPGLAVLRGRGVEERGPAHRCHVDLDEAVRGRREAEADMVGQGDGSVGEEVPGFDPRGEWAVVDGVGVSRVVAASGDRQRVYRPCGSGQLGVGGGLLGDVRKIDVGGQDMLGESADPAQVGPLGDE